MNAADLKKILAALSRGKMNPDEALEKLTHFPTEDIGFASIDHHRELRQGFAEVIYGEGKSDGQTATIARKLLATGAPVLVTRTTKGAYTKIKRFAPAATFHEAARAITIEKKRPAKKTGAILVVSAGTSDLPVAEEAALTASLMGSQVETLHDVGVAGIHRLLAHNEKLRSANVVVVVAGMDGALPSVVGGLVAAPVIAVPTSVGYGAAFGGLAALLAMLNSCASGLTVVNIDNGFGAGVAAHKINQLRSGTKQS